MNQIIMYCLAAGVLLSGLDCIWGNRFGLGSKFEEGFHLLGPMALSMSGITCLTPLLADFALRFFSPVFHFLGVDPAICGGLLPIDAGSYPLALELAEDSLIGQYFGVVAAATFGCTIVFVIPVGMRYLDGDAQQDLAKGLLIGLAALPAGLIPGGLLCGLSLWDVLRQSFPILLISLLLLWEILRNTTITIRWFSLFSKGIQSVSSLGLILAAFQSLTGWTLISKLGSLEEAMAVVCSIGIVMLGCMPLTAILQAFMKKHIQYITQKNHTQYQIRYRHASWNLYCHAYPCYAEGHG